MKIIVACRTLNESRNIERFCRGYEFADKILIADGGSLDDTVEKANRFENVEVRKFDKKVERNGIWRNPHGEHINFLIAWANLENADWLIFDDCDCVPNLLLREKARVIFEEAEAQWQPLVYAYRMYLFGEDRWFPDLNKPGQSLWAWNYRRVDIRASDSDFNHEMVFGRRHRPLAELDEEIVYKIDFPLALMHRSWPDEVEIQRKLDFYRKIGNPNTAHPLKWAGKLEKLPEWAKD